MTSTRLLAGFAAAALLAQAAAAQNTPETQAPLAPAPTVAAQRGIAEGVVATVNDQVISSYDLRQRMLLLMITSGVQPTQENIQALQQQALRGLIDERLQLQELDRYEVAIENAEVDSEVQNMAAENNLTPAQLEAGLAQAGVGMDTLRQQIRAQIGWRRLVGGRYGSRVRVGDDQVQAAMRQIAAAAAKPQYLVGEIFIDSARAGGPEQARQGAQQLFAQMQQGAPFQAVARQFSSAPSAARGGDAGWLIAGEIKPTVLEQALQQMRPGQLSNPIPTEDGVWLLYLREKREGGAGSSVIALKQAAVRLPADAPESDVAAARSKLSALRGRLKGCASVEEEASRVSGVQASDLGETDAGELAPAFRDATAALEPGQASEPVRTAAGLHLLVVCDRRATGPGLPDAEAVEGQIYNQQLTMLARRYMRDLRNGATVETR